MEKIEKHSLSAAVLAFTPTGNAILTRCTLPASGRGVFALPAGEVRPGETPDQAAARGLAEATGCTPDELLPLDQCFPAHWQSAHSIYIFTARVGEQGWPAPVGPEADEVVEIPWPELLKLALYGEGVDPTLAVTVLRLAALANQGI